MNKDFKLDERVVIQRVGGDVLEGATGSIVGRYGLNIGLGTDPNTGSYIVLLDKPVPGFKAIVITGYCLDRV